MSLRGDVLGRPVGYVVPKSERQPIVTKWSGMTDFHHAPPSYGIFFKQYHNYTCWYLSRFGFCSRDLEDVVMDLMTRFMERDSLGVFSNAWGTQSKTGQSVFRTYYTHFLLSYARGKRRNLARVSQYEHLLCDRPVDEDSKDTWIIVHGPTTELSSGITDEENFQDLVSRIDIDESLYDALFVIWDMAKDADPVHATGLARRLGCSRSEAAFLLARVRQAIAFLSYERCNT